MSDPITRLNAALGPQVGLALGGGAARRGNATPSTYMVDGKQYIVIAAGGGKNGAPSGGTYVAFALPKFAP